MSRDPESIWYWLWLEFVCWRYRRNRVRMIRWEYRMDRLKRRFIESVDGVQAATPLTPATSERANTDPSAAAGRED